MSDTVTRIHRKFDPRNFNADHSGLKSSIWAHDLDEGESFEDCTNPDAYSRVMASRAPVAGDEVQVRTHDRSRRVDFLVLAADKSWLKLQPLLRADRPEVEIPAASALGIKWNVGKRKYDVIRKSDNAVLMGGFALKEDAAAWIAEHQKAMAA